MDPQNAEDKTAGPSDESAGTYLRGAKLAVALLSLFSCMFLVALDQLILTTSSPRIVSHFNALDDIAWITTAYFLGQASFMLVFGKIVTLAPVKSTMFASIFLFEVGSALAGAAPNMTVLLLGRTVSGIGAAGMYVCLFVMIANITRLDQRARVMGFGGLVFALSSIIGPLVGGAFADSSASWRWCFYINIPIGGLAATGLLIIIPSAPAPPSDKTGWRKLLAIDPLGCIMIIGTVVCFLVPLTTGGNVYAWDSAVICTLFPVSAIFLAALLLWCHHRGEEAVLPIYLLRNRSMIGACIHGFFVWGSMMIPSVFVPYYFQAVKGSTATHSALQLLPFTLCNAPGAAIGAIITSRTGHFWHLLVLPPLLAAVGYGMLYTLGVHSPLAAAYGYQVIAAVGLGATMQQNMMVPQVVYDKEPTYSKLGMSLVSFVSFIGRSVTISTASAALLNKLHKEVPRALPNAPADVIALIEQSIDAVRTLPPQYKTGAIAAYAESLKFAFIIGVPFCCCAALGGLLVKPMRILKKDEHPVEMSAVDAVEKKSPRRDDPDDTVASLNT